MPYQQAPGPIGAHPVLWGGVFVFIGAYAGKVMLHWESIGLLRSFGIALIIVGSVLSIMER